MPVTPANFLSLSLDYLKEMIADSETWRALVAEPNHDWDSLATLIAAETSSEADAKAKIVEGVFEEDIDHKDYVSRPRIAIRHLDEYEAERVSTTGFELNGVLLLTFEIPVPAGLIVNAEVDSFQDAYIDAANKIGGVIKELSELTPQAGYLHLTNLSMGAIGMAHPDDFGGDLFFVSEWLVQFQGGP